MKPPTSVVITCPHCKLKCDPSPMTALALKLGTGFTGHSLCPHCGTELTIDITHGTLRVSEGRD
jgi:hypothetical protein